MKRHEILFLLCLINFSFCLYGNVSYFTKAKTFGFCIFDCNIFLHAAVNDYIGNQTRLNAEKTAQTLSYDTKLGRLVGVLHFGANSVESDSRLDRITPPLAVYAQSASARLLEPLEPLEPIMMRLAWAEAAVQTRVIIYYGLWCAYVVYVAVLLIVRMSYTSIYYMSNIVLCILLVYSYSTTIVYDSIALNNIRNSQWSSSWL